MLRFLGELLLVALVCGIVIGMFHPVCVPLSAVEVRHLRPPFDERDDHDMLYLRVYQRRAGQPMECKTWLTRELAF